MLHTFICAAMAIPISLVNADAALPSMAIVQLQYNVMLQIWVSIVLQDAVTMQLTSWHLMYPNSPLHTPQLVYSWPVCMACVQIVLYSTIG